MLIDCIKCGHRISDRASACPKCSTPIALQREPISNIETPPIQKPTTEIIPPVNQLKVEPSAARSQQVVANRGKASLPLGAVILCLALGAAGAFAYMNLTGSDSQNPTDAESDERSSAPNASANKLPTDQVIAVEEAKPSSASGTSPEEQRSQYFSPSFSCGAATSATEHAICGDEELARLDRETAEAYAQALSTSGESRPKLVSSQKQWLKARDSQCSENKACLKQALDERIVQLHAISAPLLVDAISEHNALDSQIKAPSDLLTVSGRWKYGDGTQQESDEGEWLCLELDPPSTTKNPLLKKFEGNICLANPERAMRQMNLAPSRYRERCAYRAEGTAIVELSELHQPPYDEMNGDRIEASLVRVLKYEIAKPLTEEDCYQ